MSMPPVMNDEEVIALVRKEHERQLRKFCDKHGIDMKSSKEETDSGEEKDEKPKKEKPRALDIERLRPGIRTSHIDSGLEYYISAIDKQRGVVELETPEGWKFNIGVDELQKEYQLD